MVVVVVVMAVVVELLRSTGENGFTLGCTVTPLEAWNCGFTISMVDHDQLKTRVAKMGLKVG